jgi:hypothetical protein
MDTAPQNNKFRRTRFDTKTPRHQISPKALVHFGVLVFWWQKKATYIRGQDVVKFPSLLRCFFDQIRFPTTKTEIKLNTGQNRFRRSTCPPEKSKHKYPQG